MDKKAMVFLFLTPETRTAVQMIRVQDFIIDDAPRKAAVLGEVSCLLSPYPSFYMCYFAEETQTDFSMHMGNMQDTLDMARRKVLRTIEGSDLECPICLEAISLDAEQSRWFNMPCSCGVRVHIECMQATGDHSRCPVCRQELSEELSFFQVADGPWHLRTRPMHKQRGIVTDDPSNDNRQ